MRQGVVCADRNTLRSLPIPDDLRAKLTAVLTQPSNMTGIVVAIQMDE